jgi:hypothetical protein
MTAHKHHSELQISENMEFQRRTWLAERVGWIVLGAVLVAALLGLLGGGGFIASDQLEGEGLTVHYDRFLRVDSQMRLRIVARPTAESDTSLRIWISRDYVEALSLTTTTPQPDRVEAGADRYVFEFALADSTEAAAIVFELEARELGRLRGEIGVEGGSSVRFGQLVYP